MNWDKLVNAMGYENFKSFFIRLYTVEKKSLAYIAGELGCSVPTIKKQAILNGLQDYIRPKGRLTPFLTEDELTGTLDEASEKTGLSRSTIWYRRKQASKILKEMSHIMNLETSETDSEKTEIVSSEDDPTLESP